MLAASARFGPLGNLCSVTSETLSWKEFSLDIDEYEQQHFMLA